MSDRRHWDKPKHTCDMRLRIEMGLPEGIETKIRTAIDGAQGFRAVTVAVQAALGNDWWVYRGASHCAVHRETGLTDKGERYAIITCEA